MGRFDTNPYEEHIDACEQLIYFLARQNRKKAEDGQDTGDQEPKQAAAAEESSR